MPKVASYDNIKVYHCGDIPNLERLLEEQSRSRGGAVSSKQQAEYITEYLTRLHAKTVLVESDVLDHGFVEDHTAYYARCFKSYPKTCVRLHFFSDVIEETDLLALFTGTSPNLKASHLQKHYLGFMVVKPIPDTFIGRTCLKPPKHRKTSFILKREYKANPFGLPLTVDTVAFQEQDRAVAVCATSALWSVFQITGKIHSHPCYSPAEITNLATRGSSMGSPALATDGLTMTQMQNAIKHVGLEAKPYTNNLTGRALRNILYSFLSLKLPLIMNGGVYEMHKDPKKPGTLVGMHAVAVVGYKLGAQRGRNESDRLLPVLMSDRLRHVFVHDDQLGPFAPMLLDDKEIPVCETDALGTLYEPSKYSMKTKLGKNLRFVPVGIIVPHYHKVRVNLDIVHEIIAVLNERISNGNPDRNIVWDVRLTSVNDFKNEVLHNPRRFGQYSVRVLKQSMPRYLWRATACTDAGEPMWDILIDATGLDHDPEFFSIEYDEELAQLVKKTDSPADVSAAELFITQLRNT